MGMIADFFRRLKRRRMSRRERMAALIADLRATGMRIGDNVAIYSCVLDSNFPFLIEIGSDCIITHATILAHDASPTVVGRGVVAGRVKIGSRCFVGAGAIVLPGVTIGDGCIVAAQAVVTKDVAPGMVVVGSPARVMCTTEEWQRRLDVSSGRKRLIPTICDGVVPTEAQSEEVAERVRRDFGDDATVAQPHH